MEINEAIIIFIVGLVFGFVSAKWIINWAIEAVVKRIINEAKELKKGEIWN